MLVTCKCSVKAPCSVSGWMFPLSSDENNSNNNNILSHIINITGGDGELAIANGSASHLCMHSFILNDKQLLLQLDMNEQFV